MTPSGNETPEELVSRVRKARNVDASFDWCFADGRYEVAWSARDVGPNSLRAFVESYEAKTAKRARSVRDLRFHLAAIDDPRLLNRVEGALGRHFREQSAGVEGSFFDAGIRVPAWIPTENPIRLAITSAVGIELLPAELVV